MRNKTQYVIERTDNEEVATQVRDFLVEKGIADLSSVSAFEFALNGSGSKTSRAKIEKICAQKAAIGSDNGTIKITPFEATNE